MLPSGKASTSHACDALQHVSFPAATTCVYDNIMPLYCRSFMPYLVDMLHHPSEHVRGYAARHMSYLHRLAGDVVGRTFFYESRGRLDRLLLHLANSKDFDDRASYASLIGVCSLHGDVDMLEELNNMGTCQLVYSLLEQADSDSSKSQLLYSLAVGTFARHSGDMLLLSRKHAPEWRVLIVMLQLCAKQ